MSDYQEARKKYMEDKRLACKYGLKCYQENSEHHEKYKHPPKRTDFAEQPSKKMKIETENKEIKVVNINQEIEAPKKQIESPKKPIEKEVLESKPYPETKNVEKNPQFITVGDAKTFIKEKFLVNMPEDFYEFWEFCKTLNKSSPMKAFDQFGIELVGPFDVLAGKFDNTPELSSEEYLNHWRFFYDIPEFQTVINTDDKNGLHIGYFRDSPEELPVFMASNEWEKGGQISTMGENIFAAVDIYLENLKKVGDPFKKMSITKIQSSLQTKAKELNLSLNSSTPQMKKRNFKTVTKTWNGIGLVVPYNKKTELGYRELAMKNKELKALFDKIKAAHDDQKPKLLSELQPVLTYASIALDECDFGTGVELGWNIMAHGIETLNATALRFLSQSYSLLKREGFAKIAEAHLKNRRKGCSLSSIKSK